MSNDTWSLVDITVTDELAEAVADMLWSLGVVAIEEITVGQGRVILRTSMGDDPAGLERAVSSRFPEALVTISEHDRAVADTWREFAEPTWVTDSVALVPAWCEPPAGCTPVFVEPYDTFGLGNHPTTVLTLRLALKNATATSTVFDFGSGSGVLAVALARITGCSVFAYDIAGSARQALRQNMQTNNVTTCTWIDGFPQTRVDVVVANILAPVLEAEATSIARSLGPGGVAVLSGIRDEQLERVLGHYRDFEETERESLDGWCAVVLKKA